MTTPEYGNTNDAGECDFRSISSSGDFLRLVAASGKMTSAAVRRIYRRRLRHLYE